MPMTLEMWQRVVNLHAGDKASDLARYLHEVDQARARLRRLGIGVSGTPITDEVDEIERLLVEAGRQG